MFFVFVVVFLEPKCGLTFRRREVNRERCSSSVGVPRIHLKTRLRDETKQLCKISILSQHAIPRRGLLCFQIGKEFFLPRRERIAVFQNMLHACELVRVVLAMQGQSSVPLRKLKKIRRQRKRRRRPTSEGGFDTSRRFRQLLPSLDVLKLLYEPFDLFCGRVSLKRGRHIRCGSGVFGKDDGIMHTNSALSHFFQILLSILFNESEAERRRMFAEVIIGTGACKIRERRTFRIKRKGCLVLLASVHRSFYLYCGVLLFEYGKRIHRARLKIVFAARKDARLKIPT
ncbi:MAG: hypothetical protein UY50_C0027G0034 [Parcubacteria group bacterium GW2011_GWA2_49_9]|nr:MAG: hypothetical protein UY50_C0027G0034 [Parcubacteria group bacterium GW2011_GWA2_49_9]